ncbi:MAG: hypothetical protein AB2L24_05910 [Mangrovibacterium sp.]
MSTIYDNIEKYLEEGLNRTLETSKRADFCIGYFKLRGWRRIAENIDKLEGDFLPEEFEDDSKYYCRVLIDTVLTQHYGFTEEELDFIINYDIKYRMGKALFGEEENEEEEDD